MYRKIAVIAVAFLMLNSIPAYAGVEIRLSAPGQFLDLKMPDTSAARGQEQFIRAMHKELSGLADKHLGPEQNLRIVFEQVDLAGNVEPMRGSQAREVRVVNTMDPLRLKFSYAIAINDDSVTAQGSEDIKTFISQADMHGKGKNRELFFERRVMRKWFLSEFGDSQ